MRHKWLFKAKKESLIIFFNGWGMDCTPFAGMETVDYDVLMFYDYKNLDIESYLVEECARYKNTVLIGWSFGVWAAAQVGNKFNPQRCIAVNGTPFAIHERFGIPSKLYDLTLSTLSEKTLLLFYKNMFINSEGEDNFSKFLEKMPKRELQEQKEELLLIKEQVLAGESKDPESKDIMSFDTAIIGKHDRIIPSKNQLYYWKSQPNTRHTIIDAPHFLFDLFKNWDDLVG